MSLNKIKCLSSVTFDVLPTVALLEDYLVILRQFPHKSTFKDGTASNSAQSLSLSGSLHPTPSRAATTGSWQLLKVRAGPSPLTPLKLQEEKPVVELTLGVLLFAHVVVILMHCITSSDAIADFFSRWYNLWRIIKTQR